MPLKGNCKLTPPALLQDLARGGRGREIGCDCEPPSSLSSIKMHAAATTRLASRLLLLYCYGSVLIMRAEMHRLSSPPRLRKKIR